MRNFSISIAGFIAIFLCAPLLAQERLDLQGIEIIGNQELPRILYIVPWKPVERFDITSPPIVSIMEQKLSPLERASFKRKIHYHEAIFSRADLKQSSTRSRSGDFRDE